MSLLGNNYGTVESTRCSGRLYSFMSDVDVENGSVVAMGALVSGETDIYTGAIPATTDKVYLVDNPAWSYEEEYKYKQNEDEFINKTGLAYRGRELKELDKFKVKTTSITPITAESVVTPLAVGQLVVVDGSTRKLKALASTATVTSYAFVGVIERLEDVGFPWCVGSIGTSDATWGSNMSTAVTKVVIRVKKNQ